MLLVYCDVVEGFRFAVFRVLEFDDLGCLGRMPFVVAAFLS